MFRQENWRIFIFLTSRLFEPRNEARAVLSSRIARVLWAALTACNIRNSRITCHLSNWQWQSSTSRSLNTKCRRVVVAGQTGQLSLKLTLLPGRNWPGIIYTNVNRVLHNRLFFILLACILSCHSKRILIDFLKLTVFVRF